ncbi:MAG: DMT family transporter [Paludibacteraceae bacterium]|nr:DMT family transporter [Paludibacteraceae bacterium]
MDIKLKGCLYGAVAAMTYGMNPLFAVTLYNDGMNPDSVLLFRYLFALPVLAVMIKMRGHDFRLTLKETISLFIVGMLVATSSLTLYVSYKYLSAGIASTILFVYPVIVAVLMVMFFGEKLRLLTVICIALAVGGIAMLYKSDGTTTLNPIGCIIVLGSSLTYAIYIVAVGRDSYKKIPTLKLTFYTLLFGALLYVVRIVFFSEFVCPPIDRWDMWLNIACMAIFPTVLSFVWTTMAIQYVGATPTAILGALEPVTAVVLGITFLGESLSFRETIGLVMILMAVCIVIGGKSITDRLLRIRKLFPRGK